MYNQHSASNAQQNTQGYGFRGGNCGGFFGKRFGGGRFGGQWSGKAPWAQMFGSRKSANIEDNADNFTISLYAAGLSKDAFKIAVKDDVLSVSYTAPETTEATGNFIHQEYQPVSFERSFQLNGKVLTDSISASYVDGVLKIVLPKNPESNTPAQEVEVK